MSEKYKYLIILVASVIVYSIIQLLIYFGILNDYYVQIIIFIGINIILAVSLNLVLGITGQFSLGHAGFMSVGGYLSAIISIKLGLPFPIALIIGGIGAAIIGLVIGFPILRLKGDYLGITTLGFGEIIRVIFVNIDYVGGARGLMAIPKKTTFTATYIATIITVLVIVNIIRSTHGRALKAVREDEIAAQSMGIDISKYKLTAFVIASFFAGIAGGLYAHFLMYINPQSFGFLKSIDIVMMVVIGGMGNLFGSIIAATGITTILELLRELQDYRMIIFPIILILTMLYKPSGLLGSRDLSISRLYNKITRIFMKGGKVKDEIANS
ncbi:branched-chain amino acid ABC transporter permease [Caloramator sp. E03]|uniref:branched-chain amino acid ABC transporter permease n=1 Tax=Caloramator sp. E03 TaxID=2576307 RepID=UPI001110D089|nr:branched-chain amino acid ABC transporter permease [Caloramator sp. E03]QCX33323.1 branched-chain amino acid ABC transporter permease [Caloramator sp. E03]